MPKKVGTKNDKFALLAPNSIYYFLEGLVLQRLQTSLPINKYYFWLQKTTIHNGQERFDKLMSPIEGDICWSNPRTLSRIFHHFVQHASFPATSNNQQ